MIFGFLIIFIFPLKYAPLFGLPVAIINAFYNYLSVAILRYNTPKLNALYKRNLKYQQVEKQGEQI
jgi:E3 ubiquitin-protein ligase DOA10